MLDSEVLEIAMGVVLSYLLVALALTSATEGAEAVRKTRARDLEIALGELLDDKEPSRRDQNGQISADHPENGLRTRFYLHPLVQALYRCRYEGGYFDRPKKLAQRLKKFPTFIGPWKAGRRLPAYIPRETFVLALSDLMGDKDGQGKGEGATASFKRAWRALSVATAGDAVRMREEIERWYEAAMDRAGSRYKRRTQGKLFFMGLALAVTLNINSVVIAMALRSEASDDRGRVLEAAKTLFAAPKPTPMSPATGTRGAGNAADAGKSGTPTPTPTPTCAPQKGVPIPGKDSCVSGVPGRPEAGATDSSDPSSSAALSEAALRATLEHAELPIGWNGTTWRTMLELAAPAGQARPCPNPLDKDKAKAAAVSESAPKVEPHAAAQQPEGRPCLAWLALPSLGLALNWLLLGAGYLATALAAMLGGPFWFDILNRLVNVRSAIKPMPKAQ